ncbi:MAG: ABC transporter ATP-binding protein [Clostridia bacterium]|nr:ABC transporter ATP-binding protein [Clostridia bacterium]
MQEPLMSVRDLRTYFLNGKKIVRAVDGVSFDVMKGEIFGLVGESGCGKSATCRSLIRLIQSSGEIVGGQILYDNKDIAQLSEKAMASIRGREIGMIFQEPMNTLNPVTTVGSQLMEVFRPLKLSREDQTRRAVEMLRLVGIASPQTRLKDYPHQFSGGMRQRAMIAIALAAQPKLLLADEPTTALDVTIQDQIIKLLLQLRDQLHMSMILVTHDLGVASRMCNRIAVMYAGRIMELAPARDLFYTPRHPYTLGLMRSMPLSGKGVRLEPISGMPPNLAQEIKGCPFAPRCAYASDRCCTELPELQEIAPGHSTRCHHAQALEGESFLTQTRKAVNARD